MCLLANLRAAACCAVNVEPALTPCVLKVYSGRITRSALQDQPLKHKSIRRVLTLVLMLAAE
jgi:hypothetical protein